MSDYHITLDFKVDNLDDYDIADILNLLRQIIRDNRGYEVKVESKAENVQVE